MIRINRSTDLQNDTVWVTIDHDETTSRCRQLYCGHDINGAVSAAVMAGMPYAEAAGSAKRALSRRDVNDQLAGV